MDLSPAGNGRMVVALAIFAGLALTVPFAIEDDKYRKLVFVFLGFFAARVVLTRLRSR